jgi:hypothetical protein
MPFAIKKSVNAISRNPSDCVEYKYKEARTLRSGAELRRSGRHEDEGQDLRVSTRVYGV